MEGAVKQIVAKERELRAQMLSDKNGDTADKLWRSFGTLKYARKLDTAEAARLISNVRFGAVCGVIPEAENINLIKLMFSVMPAHIRAAFPDASTPKSATCGVLTMYEAYLLHKNPNSLERKEDVL